MVEEQVAAPAVKAFAVLGDFGALEENEMIKEFSLKGVGAVRTIVLANGGVIEERLEQYDAASGTFVYAIINEPTALPVKNNVSTVVISAIGDNTATINWSSTFDAVGLRDEQVGAIIGGVYKNGIARTRRKLGL